VALLEPHSSRHPFLIAPQEEVCFLLGSLALRADREARLQRLQQAAAGGGDAPADAPAAAPAAQAELPWASRLRSAAAAAAARVATAVAGCSTAPQAEQARELVLELPGLQDGTGFRSSCPPAMAALLASPVGAALAARLGASARVSKAAQFDPLAALVAASEGGAPAGGDEPGVQACLWGVATQLGSTSDAARLALMDLGLIPPAVAACMVSAASLWGDVTEAEGHAEARECAHTFLCTMCRCEGALTALKAYGIVGVLERTLEQGVSPTW
jgi:hypothetical protein